MADRRQGHRHHSLSRTPLSGLRALKRPRQGPSVVRLDHAGIQRRGGAGERGLLHFGESARRSKDSPLFQRH
jgi:hypothetical protein